MRDIALIVVLVWFWLSIYAAYVNKNTYEWTYDGQHHQLILGGK